MIRKCLIVLFGIGLFLASASSVSAQKEKPKLPEVKPKAEVKPPVAKPEAKPPEAKPPEPKTPAKAKEPEITDPLVKAVLEAYDPEKSTPEDLMQAVKLLSGEYNNL